MKALLISAILAAVTLIATPVYASDVLYPDDVYQMCEEIAAGRIQPEFVQAVIERESQYDADAVNGNCKGLMQINMKWQQERAEKLGVTDIMDPYQNIQLGTEYLVDLFDEYQDPYLVLMLYNMGPSAEPVYESGKYSKYAIGICEKAEQLEAEHEK